MALEIRRQKSGIRKSTAPVDCFYTMAPTLLANAINAGGAFSTIYGSSMMRCRLV
jgi:hypothetical protein